MPTPTQGIANAIDAYNEAVRNPGKAAPEPPSGAGSEFGNLVRGAIDEARKIGEKSESLSVAGIADRADIGQVVTAVAEAEVTLQTVVAIRDKVIDAYKDIIRMPM